MRRVVITGLGAVSPLGSGVDALMEGIAAGRSAVQFMKGWDAYTGLRSLIAAPVELRDERSIARKHRRSMGRMSIFAVQAAEQALCHAGIDAHALAEERSGCIIGSTMGSAESINRAFEIMLPERDLSNLSAMLFFQCVAHTAAMNVAQYLGMQGPVYATAAACASGLHAIGTAYNLIRQGDLDMALCGGAEELHPTVTGSFDVLFATSTRYNATPTRSPRPFDRDRDGLVCGEGSGILLLEEFEHARRRNAPVVAELCGFYTCTGGMHVSQSNSDAVVRCIQGCVAAAGISPGDVDYVSAHATGTVQGDSEEAIGIRNVLGGRVPTSSLKGHIGHTLAASGPLELIATLEMLRTDTLYPTLNLETVAEDCEGIAHVREQTAARVNVILKNSFAFGGVNASVVCRRI